MSEANEVMNRRSPSRVKTKILCIDTEPEIIQRIKDAGYTVFDVSMGYRTGKRAFPFPAPNEVHLIVCDLKRPACFDSTDWGPSRSNNNFKCKIIPFEKVSNSFSVRDGRRSPLHKLIYETQLGKQIPGTFGSKEVNRAIVQGGVPFLLFLNEEWLSHAEVFPDWLDVRWTFLPTAATQVEIAEPLSTLLPEVQKEVKLKFAIQHQIEEGPLFRQTPPPFPISAAAVASNNIRDVFGQFVKMGKGSVWLLPSTHQNVDVIELFASRLEVVRQLSLSPQMSPSTSKDTREAPLKQIFGPQPATKGEALPNTSIRVFISHSSADVEIAKALIELLRDAMPDLHPGTIRCTSVPGYKLSGGADTDNELRQEMRDALVFIGLLTNQSLASTYVLFELGARWGADSRFTPLVAAGLQASKLKAPLNGMHAQSCDSETDLHQMLGEIAGWLSLKILGANVYDGHLKKLVELSKAEGKLRSEAVSSSAPASVGRAAGPRIEQSQPREVNLFRDELNQWSITSGTGVRGVIVPFYYNPKSDTRPEIYVRAHIVFIDSESGSRVVVSAGCWIGEYLNAAGFKPGDEKSVLLLAFEAQGKAFTCRSRREHYNDFQSQVGLVDDIPLPPTPQRVEITLLWDNDRATQSYTFELPDRRPPAGKGKQGAIEFLQSGHLDRAKPCQTRLRSFGTLL